MVPNNTMGVSISNSQGTTTPLGRRVSKKKKKKKAQEDEDLKRMVEGVGEIPWLLFWPFLKYLTRYTYASNFLYRWESSFP